jgi:hypothetical protein
VVEVAVADFVAVVSVDARLERALFCVESLPFVNWVHESEKEAGRMDRGLPPLQRDNQHQHHAHIYTHRVSPPPPPNTSTETQQPPPCPPCLTAVTGKGRPRLQ